LQGVVVLQDALYPALFLKPTENLDNALRLFRKAKRPMALVRDDEGVILGLITLEDVLEEIIGDIEDEHDQPLRRVPRTRRPLTLAETSPLLRKRAAAADSKPQMLPQLAAPTKEKASQAANNQAAPPNPPGV
jgi:CBS domain containing-hemolysin-like protein